MARIDKYQSAIGGFRAKLGFTPVDADVGAIIGVGLNGSGRIVKGAGTTGVVGVLCLSSLLGLGDVADVMTSGEIVDVTGLAAGTSYWAAAADGALGATATGKVRVGHTVEAWRLVVRVGTDTVTA